MEPNPARLLRESSRYISVALFQESSRPQGVSDGGNGWATGQKPHSQLDVLSKFLHLLGRICVEEVRKRLYTVRTFFACFRACFHRKLNSVSNFGRCVHPSILITVCKSREKDINIRQKQMYAARLFGFREYKGHFLPSHTPYRPQTRRNADLLVNLKLLPCELVGSVFAQSAQSFPSLRVWLPGCGCNE